ncbi:MAG: hypothetical protein HKN23_04250 [Verrucomicrobiales bacterium]|nr:hypothetical protein [Verrucomicrobiales bacterium]
MNRVVPILFFAATVAFSQTASALSKTKSIRCEGDYKYHLQGVCRDDDGNLYWSFTTDLVKTDPTGKLIRKIPVVNHHGDLCFANGKIYVAVNLGRFNDPEGNADSWVYVYDAKTLKELATHPVQEVFHGAGGMDSRDGKFFVVGGLPDGVEENYVYEYDAKFKFAKKHVVKSGWTRLGIQTAVWHDEAWWFGCYGSPKILVKTDADFKFLGRYEFDCSLGIVGLAPGKFYVAEGPVVEKRHLGVLRIAQPDEKRGLVLWVE